MSGSQSKASGSAGGYLLDFEDFTFNNLDPVPVRFIRPEELVLGDFAGAIRWHYDEQKEPHEADFRVFSHLTGSGEVFLDVGANIGNSVASFRKFNRQAKVVSFEPCPWLEPALAWLKRKELDRFDYYMVGAGSRSEVKQLWIPCLDNVPIFYLASFVAERFGPDPAAIGAMKQLMGFTPPNVYGVCNVDVRLEPVDSFELNPSIVKIDSEQYEFEVLQGMERTIGSWRPLIMIEGGNRHTSIRTFFEAHDYDFAERMDTKLCCTKLECAGDNGFFLARERIPAYVACGLLVL